MQGLPILYLESDRNMATIEGTWKALSDPVRKEILELLRDGQKHSAGEIASHFNLTNATVSYHLSVLKKADLIRENKVKTYIYYELNTSVLDEMILWLQGLKGERK